MYRYGIWQSIQTQNNNSWITQSIGPCGDRTHNPYRRRERQSERLIYYTNRAVNNNSCIIRIQIAWLFNYMYFNCCCWLLPKNFGITTVHLKRESGRHLEDGPVNLPVWCTWWILREGCEQCRTDTDCCGAFRLGLGLAADIFLLIWWWCLAIAKYHIYHCLGGASGSDCCVWGLGSIPGQMKYLYELQMIASEFWCFLCIHFLYHLSRTHNISSTKFGTGWRCALFIFLFIYLYYL